MTANLIQILLALCALVGSNKGPVAVVGHVRVTLKPSCLLALETGPITKKRQFALTMRQYSAG